MTVTAERTKLYFCRCCVLHDRVTVRYSDDVPELPCPRAGTEPNDCKRIDWQELTYYCTICRQSGRTVIHHGKPGNAECLDGHSFWEPTDETRYVLANLPASAEDDA